MLRAMFWMILVRQALALRTDQATLPMSSENKTTSAVSMAAGDPAAPMATPTSAAARAGASFTPSPTIATAPWSRLSSATASTLSSGRMECLTWDSRRPTALATLRADPSLSPVTMAASTPIPARALTAAAAFLLTKSAAAATPRALPSTAAHTAVIPSPSHDSKAFRSPAASEDDHPFPAAASFTFPTTTNLPSTTALAPAPGMVLYETTSADASIFLSSASLSTAPAIGWEDWDSRDARWNKKCRSEHQFALRILSTESLPSVRVPVLSMPMAMTRPRRSRWTPPFTSTPPRAREAIPDTTVAGVDKTRAQGHPATRRLQANSR
mmetsp:Transcript_8470/g.30572  ORF Transcript_8470/g.30572 Transcript_8470/m.30572 type:complete len:326 (-) Transcript_8470:1489-2466(-)